MGVLGAELLLGEGTGVEKLRRPPWETLAAVSGS